MTAGGVHTNDIFEVGTQVQYSANGGERWLGVVIRVWSNGRYLSIVTDGSVYVRHRENVTRCRTAT